jgi:amino acid transporter
LQGSVDGWLPRYLSHVNVHGAPTRAMWTDLGFNLILLLMSDYVFVLAVSNCCYLIFNFLNLNAGWMHRLDSPRAHRPWRAPNLLLALGAVLAFFNAFLLGAGANVYGKAALLTGLVAAGMKAAGVRVASSRSRSRSFPRRHARRSASGRPATAPRRAGWLPYAALGGGCARDGRKLMFG